MSETPPSQPDAIDCLIKRLERKRVHLPVQDDIDVSDTSELRDATAQLEKRGGFPIIGAPETENEEQARVRARERRKQLERQTPKTDADEERK